MTEENPGILSHVSVGTNQFQVAIAFYDSVLVTLGCKRIMEHPDAVAYGKVYPEFWVQTPSNGAPASSGNGVHFGFVAPSPQAVDAFHDAAIKAGASSEGEPGSRPEYGEPYYGCFVRDLDGNKIEATCWDPELASTS